MAKQRLYSDTKAVLKELRRHNRAVEEELHGIRDKAEDVALALANLLAVMQARESRAFRRDLKEGM